MQQKVTSILAAFAAALRWAKDRNIFIFDVPMSRRVAHPYALTRRNANQPIIPSAATSGSLSESDLKYQANRSQFVISTDNEGSREAGDGGGVKRSRGACTTIPIQGVLPTDCPRN